jgi:hypothetical protein
MLAGIEYVGVKDISDVGFIGSSDSAVYSLDCRLDDRGNGFDSQQRHELFLLSKCSDQF